MACACKVGKQLDFLQKKYGANQPKNKNTNIVETVRLYVFDFVSKLMVLPILPFILIFAPKDSIKGGILKIDKIFNLK